MLWRAGVQRSISTTSDFGLISVKEEGGLTMDKDRIAGSTKKIAGGIKEAAGKKLDFLSQEMIREINTMGSKSRTADIRTVVIDLKTEVERIREQVQNVE